jgi:hypothetical protein
MSAGMERGRRGWLRTIPAHTYRAKRHQRTDGTIIKKGPHNKCDP